MHATDAPRSHLLNYAASLPVTPGNPVDILSIGMAKKEGEYSAGMPYRGDMGYNTVVSVSAQQTGDRGPDVGRFDVVLATVSWNGGGKGGQSITFDALRGGTISVPGTQVKILGSVSGEGTYLFNATANHATIARSGPLIRTFVIGPITGTTVNVDGIVPFYAMHAEARQFSVEGNSTFNYYTGDPAAPTITYAATVPSGLSGGSLVTPRIGGIDRGWRYAVNPGDEPFMALLSFTLDF